MKKIEQLTQEAIEFLRDNEPEGGYAEAFSGGKDSCVIDNLIEKSGCKYTKHFARTSIDPPELLDFIKEYHKNTIWHRPKYTMYQLIVRKKMLPSRIIRYCCEALKHYWNEVGEYVVTGIRKEESKKRQERLKVEKFGKAIMINPILDWTEKDVWEYIDENKIPYCILYDEGFQRIGCVGCPLVSYKKMYKEFQRYPKIRYAYLKTIEKIKDNGNFDDFDNAEDIMQWWMLGISKAKYLGMKEQLEIDFKEEQK